MNPYEKQWRGLWTLEYNKDQNKFHIEEADTRFQSAMEQFVEIKTRKEESPNQEFLDKLDKMTSNNWHFLGVFNSYGECEKYKDWIIQRRLENSVGNDENDQNYRSRM